MKNISLFNLQFWSRHWEKIGDNLLAIVWQLLLTTVIFGLIDHFGKKIINRYLAQKRRKSKRRQTITALIISIFQYTVIFFYLFGVLSILGIPVGTLLASAGIFSLAIGMGAQGFVSDLVNGFFILSEDQFDVGDTVSINEQIGTVVQLGLRTTRIKTTSGAIIYIPNRQITMVKNLAHNAISLNIDLQLAVNNNFKQVANIIDQVNHQLGTEKRAILAGPKIIGITAQKGSTVTFTIAFKVRPAQQNKIKNCYLSSYILALQKEKINFAQPSGSTQLESH